MAAFSDEEKRILANILPGVAAALRSPLNNLHMAAQRLTQGQKGDSAESAIMRQSYYRMLRSISVTKASSTRYTPSCPSMDMYHVPSSF